jgi:hypothetical protein
MKKVSFIGKRPTVPPGGTVDNWVSNREAEPQKVEPKEATKRLTIDVPVGLHRRIKSQCAVGGLVMADEIRSLLERRFPSDPERGGAS